MCNLYHLSPKVEVANYFRTLVPDSYVEGAVGPFGAGAFLTDNDGDLRLTLGQWGMVAPGSKTRRPGSKAILTNNARIETIASKWTYKDAWRAGRRCLIPAAWYQEPNWESGKNIWWRMRRADGLPWALAGIWSEWLDPDSGELVPNYTMITCNCDGHPLLGRLHKPDPKLPPDAQDKRAVVHIAPERWHDWLRGDNATALQLIKPEAVETFDLDDAHRTDALLAQQRGPGAPQQGSFL